MAVGVAGGPGDPVPGPAEAEQRLAHVRVQTHPLPMAVVTVPGPRLIQHPAIHITAQVSSHISLLKFH
jgi:hypothetical protein